MSFVTVVDTDCEEVNEELEDRGKERHYETYEATFYRDSIEHHETCWTSEYFYVRNLQWRVHIASYDNLVNFEVCSNDITNEDEDLMTVEVDVSFRIWCQTDRSRDIVVFRHGFLDKKFDITGYYGHEFESFANPDNGFVVDQKVILEVTFKTQPIVFTSIIPSTTPFDQEVSDITRNLDKLIHLVQDTKVTFIVKGVKILGHRDFLSFKSIIFKQLCEDASAASKQESNSSQSLEVTLPDKITVNAFLCVLRFVYHKKVSFRMDDVKDVLVASDFFHVDDLTRYAVCVIDHHNIFRNFKCYRDELSNPFVYQYCLRIIDQDFSEIIDDSENETFQEIERELLEVILSRDSLHVDELELFKACLSWAAAQCKKQHLEVNGSNERKVLGRCLDLIRFPVMSLEDFITTIPSHVLSLEEVSKIFLYFISESQLHIKYNVKERKYKREFWSD